MSKHNQRDKYYQLTAAGRKHLDSEHTRWAALVSAMSGILEPRKSEG